MRNFFKNTILCGEIDFHCLLCSETFHHETDVDRHIRWENHRKKIKTKVSVDKFNGDSILKIDSNFYCELCNLLFPTSLKTGLHVKEERHIQNKQNNANEVPRVNLVKRETDSGSIIIANNIHLNEREWNGIVDKQCIICDADLNDVAAHMILPSHTVQLIQTKVNVQDGENYFRRIDNGIAYCFTCKQALTTNDLEDHIKSKEHIDNRTKIYNAATSSSQVYTKEFKNNLKKMFVFTDPEEKAKSEITKKIKAFNKENIEIDLNNSKATCKICNFTPTFSVKAINEHIKMHKSAENKDAEYHISADGDDECETDSGESLSSDSEDEKEYVEHKDHGQIRAQLSKYGKDNFIKLINSGSKGYCTLCDTKISAHIKNFKQHVDGTRHVGHLELKGLKKKSTKKVDSKDYTTKPLKTYLRNVFFVKQMDDYWINQKFSIDKHSFVGMCHLENGGKYDKIKCFLCDDTFPKDKDQAHASLLSHKTKLFDSKVITSVKHEFIRELKPNLYHCGFCNEVYPAWTAMKKHLKTFKHAQLRNEHEMVADLNDDMYSMYISNERTADTDLLWNQMMGNRLL